LAGSRRLGLWIVLGLVVYCLPTGLLIVMHEPAAAFVLQAVRGAGTIVVDVLAITALQRSVSGQLMARVFGVSFALVLAAISIGALVTPALLGAFGLNVTLLLVSVGVSVVVVASYPWVRRADLQALAGAARLEPRIAVLEKANIFRAASRTVLERLAKGCRRTSLRRWRDDHQAGGSRRRAVRANRRRGGGEPHWGRRSLPPPQAPRGRAVFR
jgi:hypothetical protein